MSKYKYLLKNIFLLMISGFGTKILSLILIPLYTNVLTPEEYGTYDIYSTTISLMLPILTLEIVSSVMRFSLDKEKNKKIIFSIGLKYSLLASLIFTGMVVINNAFDLFPVFEKYYLYFILMFVSSIFYSLFTQFISGLEKIVDVAISGAINSIAILGLNILFLLAFDMGLEGYFIANIVASILPIIYLFFKNKLWKYITFRKSEKELKEEMFSYSKPLVANTLSWWVNNASDRYIVTFFCGVAANGIYSVAYKIPSILNAVQSIFNSAWTLSAVKSLEDEDCSEFYSNVYRICNCGMIIVCAGLIMCNKLIAKILFAKDFYIAWRYAPFLMISVVFGMVSGMLGGIFSAAKKSEIFSRSTVVGAIINVILNIALVYVMGPLGAAIATLVSYVVVWFIRLIEANKIVKLKVNIKKDVFAYLILIAQSIVLLAEINFYITYIIEICLILIVVVLYKNDILELVKKVLRKRSTCYEE